MLLPLLLSLNEPGPKDNVCEHCRREAVLSDQEIAAASFVCPSCSKTSRASKLPAEVRCPTCKQLLKLDAQERLSGAVSCSRCVVASGARLPAEVKCPGCRKKLGLDSRERLSGSYSCPYCKHEVKSELGPPEQPMAMVTIEPPSEELVRHRARQDMIWGAVLFVGGSALTVGTILMGEARFIVAYGPIIYGAVRFIRGSAAHKRLPKREVPRAIATVRESPKE